MRDGARQLKSPGVTAAGPAPLKPAARQGYVVIILPAGPARQFPAAGGAKAVIFLRFNRLCCLKDARKDSPDRMVGELRRLRWPALPGRDHLD